MSDEKWEDLAKDLDDASEGNAPADSVEPAEGEEIAAMETSVVQSNGNWSESAEDSRSEPGASFGAPVAKERRVGKETGWIFGIILVLVGIGLMLRNMGIMSGNFLHNWWALFILIPAGGALGNAWSEYQSKGRLEQSGVGSLVFGLIMLTITSIFLFNLNWGIFFPLVLLLIGVGILIGAVRR